MIDRRVLVGLVLLLVMMGFAFQGTRPLWDPDEGRYSAVALQMLESGDYLVPHLNDQQVHLTKPPITYWLIAGSMAVAGTTTWAVRLPYAICFVLTGLLVYLLATRLVPERPWLPALLWSTSLLPVLAANVVNTDTILALFETLAVAGFVMSWSSPNAHRWRLLMWAGFALGFMTKGPPALLPLLSIVVWTCAVHGRSAFRQLFPWTGIALFLLAGTGWYVWLFVKQPELIGYFFGHELVDRIFTGVHRRNPEWYGSLKIYLPVLLLCALPWILMARQWPGALVRSFRIDTWRERFRLDAEGAFLGLWLLLPMAIFMFAKSRLFLYILPLAVPITLLLGRELSRSLGATVSTRWRAGLAMWTVVAFSIKGLVMQIPSHKNAEALAHSLSAQLDGADRIVYVGERARYGLRFYTGLPVIQFESGNPQAGQSVKNAAQQGLCTAAAAAPDALLIGKPGMAKALVECNSMRLASVAQGVWRRQDEADSRLSFAVEHIQE